jgi:hypothetical protein
VTGHGAFDRVADLDDQVAFGVAQFVLQDPTGRLVAEVEEDLVAVLADCFDDTADARTAGKRTGRFAAAGTGAHQGFEIDIHRDRHRAHRARGDGTFASGAGPLAADRDFGRHGGIRAALALFSAGGGCLSGIRGFLWVTHVVDSVAFSAWGATTPQGNLPTIE